MQDAYAGLDRLYLSMHTPAEVAGEDINDPVMGEWLAKNLPDASRILDAGCGLGFDALALQRGLPARRAGKSWIVYGADYSSDMLAAAARVGDVASLPAANFRRASFAGLTDIPEWRELMDVVTVNYAIYTQPAEDTDYDAYLQEGLNGLAAVLRPGGTLIVNLRDWQAMKAADDAGTAHVIENTHDGVSYQCGYAWAFGAHRVHRTTLHMREAGGLERSTTIWLAERSLAEIELALRAAGLMVIDRGRHGEGNSAFFTLFARKEMA